MAAHQQLVLWKFDLAKQTAAFDEKPNRIIAMGKFRTAEGSSFSYQFDGDMSTQGINDSEFSDGGIKRTVYSIGIILDDPAQLFIQSLLDTLTKYCNDNNASDYEIVDPVKDGDILYLKLKTDGSGKVFQFKSNLKLTPKNYAEAANSSRVFFSGDVQAYFNLRDKKAGLTFMPKQINFDTEILKK